MSVWNKWKYSVYCTGIFTVGVVLSFPKELKAAQVPCSLLHTLRHNTSVASKLCQITWVFQRRNLERKAAYDFHPFSASTANLVMSAWNKWKYSVYCTAIFTVEVVLSFPNELKAAQVPCIAHFKTYQFCGQLALPDKLGVSTHTHTHARTHARAHAHTRFSSIIWCIHCPPCQDRVGSECILNIETITLIIALQWIQSESFSHFIIASTEGGTTPTWCISHCSYVKGSQTSWVFQPW